MPPRQRIPSRPERTGSPITAVLDLLGRRWSLRIVWELRSGPLTFRELQEACGGISASVLNTRLGELREFGIVDAGITLTREGGKLLEAYAPIERWSKRWARRTGS
jgi:DNA-binding HxlR family transcriptional regulator